jgi:pimeloyl-ACP methyl ester carboxylesterase
VAGEAMYVTHWGASGAPVVMVHGGVQGGGSAGERNFLQQKPLADLGWQLIVPDRPGHGNSPDPGRPDDYAADGDLVAELLGDGAHLVGHSFGGCVALAAAAKRPDAVHSLTLIEPGMQSFAIGDPRVMRFVFSLVITRFVAFSPESRGKRILKLLGIPPEMQDAASPAELKRMSEAVARAKFPSKQVLGSQLADLKRHAVPLLLVTGGWSPAFEATADRVAAAGGGRRAVVPSGHHFPQFVADKFNPLLDGFLRSAEAR